MDAEDDTIGLDAKMIRLMMDAEMLAGIDDNPNLIRGRVGSAAVTGYCEIDGL